MCVCFMCVMCVHVLSKSFYSPDIATMRASSGTGTALGAIGEPKRAYQVVKFLVGLANK